VEQLGLKTATFSEYERGREGTTHDVLWFWAGALWWSVGLVDMEAAGVVCTPGSSSSELVALYEELREHRAMSRQEVAHRSGWTLESLEDLEAQVKGGAQLTVVHAQLWARALGWRYEVGDSVER
jgi:transcriptional regulator with XRE-family HTH domain